LVKAKRLIKCGSEVIDVGGAKYLTSWIEPLAYGSEQFLKEAIPKAKEWQKDYPDMPFEHVLVYAVWGVINVDVVYKADEMAKYPDYWNQVDETFSDKWGDCEDCAIALTSVAHRFTDRVKLAIGYYTLGGWYGHAFCIYSSPYFNTDVVLEATWDDFITPNRAIILQSSFYHPTVIGNQKGFQQVCNCSYCQQMMEYLTTGKPLPYPKITKAKPISKNQLSTPAVKKPWWKKWHP
jgi:hypothetical protein